MKKQNKISKRKNNKKGSNIYLPPFKVERVVSVLSETIDWGLTQLHVPDTWKTTQGEDITVLIIDTGHTDHLDLTENIITDKCKTFVKSSSDKEITDYNGHSTHCIGIIGARQNGIGCVGVAPKCKIITAKVFDKSGSGTTNAVNAALQYAIELKPDIVSMSLGSPSYDPQMESLIKKLHEMNIPVIAAAGNDGLDNSVNYPGKFKECICVAAIDSDGNIANFSSRGPEVDISAPGVNIYSTWLNHQYAKLSGTSMATPFITGVVALLLSKHRKEQLKTGKNDCITVDEIKNHLIKHVDDKGQIGRDNAYGYGIVDPEKIINDLENDTVPKPVPNPNPPQPCANPPCKKKKSWLDKLKDLFKIILP